MPVTYNAEIAPTRTFSSTSGGTVFGTNTSSSVFDYFANNAVVNDALYFGNTRTFKSVKVNVGTPLVAVSITIAFEYWNGTAWVAIPSVVDNTSNFTALGTRWIEFDPNLMPNWTGNTVNGGAAYYVRARITAVTAIIEGGANITLAVRVGNHALTVLGYTAGVPCNLTDIYNADVAGGWGQVTTDDQYFKTKAHIFVGDGATATFLADVNKLLVIGSLALHRDMIEFASADIQFGSLSGGLPIGRTSNSCMIKMYGSSTGYPSLLGAFRMYGGMITDGGSTTNYSFNFNNATKGVQILYNVTVACRRVIYAGGIEIRRINIQFGVGTYPFTNSQAIWEDIKVIACGINIDHGYNPVLINPVITQAGNWLATFLSTSGTVRGFELNMVNATYNDFDAVPTPAVQTNGRGLVADKSTIDVSVLYDDGTPVQGAVVKIERWTGSEWCSEITETLTATNSAVIDNGVAWGQTSITVSDGTQFTIGQLYKTHTEWYEVTNIVGNVLTVVRAKKGTLIAPICLTGNPFYKQLPSVNTDVNGSIPQTVCLKRYKVYFGTSSPAPHNTGAIVNVDMSTYRITVTKDNYETEVITANLTPTTANPTGRLIQTVRLKPQIPKFEDDLGNVYDRVDKTNSGTTNLRRKIVKV